MFLMTGNGVFKEFFLPVQGVSFDKPVLSPSMALRMDSLEGLRTLDWEIPSEAEGCHRARPVGLHNLNHPWWDRV